MKKFLCISLICTLILTFPVAIFATSDTSDQNDQEQSMIGPPASVFNDESTSSVDWNAANTASSPVSEANSFTIVIDPGHQGPSVDMSAPEPVAPGSTQTKPRATSGTQGNFSGIPEYEINLQISLLLQKELSNRGYEVIMTRTDNETAISNKERAELATEKKADITVRIHANSDKNSSVEGALTMAPTSQNQYLSSDIIEKSNTLASCIISHYCAATDLQNRGIISSDNMTGTNWSTVPVAILEMGFMSNHDDDLYITNTDNHSTMIAGIADGIDEYFHIVEPEFAAEGAHLSKLTDYLQTTYTDKLEKAGENWAISIIDPATSDYSTIRANQSMEAAGLIKTFIMGAVFENIVYKDSTEQPSADYESTLKPLLEKMIADNDNFAADELVNRLGENDFTKGVDTVNRFCRDHSFSCTKMGTEFLEKNSTISNFTSASDCCRILTEIYKGNLVNSNASAEMLSLLKQQSIKRKIPEGIPANVQTANKTGEMTEDQNPVLVENDTAIIFDNTRPYIICVLSSYIKNNSDAEQIIRQISSDVYKYMTSAETDSNKTFH